MSNDLTLEQLVQELAADRGPDLRGYKHSTLERRMRRRMFQLGIGTYSEYLERVKQEPREPVELLNTVLINVTEFFREPQAWEALRTNALPLVLNRLQPGDSFRAWSAGCATGEEPYSLAILLAEHFGSSLNQYDIKIYATEIDEDALNIARRAEYSADRLRRVRPELREKYFTGNSSQLRIVREIRRLVIFGRSNIVSDAPISHCHLVTCRNVLIYFDTKMQRQILARFQYALDPGGILFLGKAESKLNESRSFRQLDSRWRIFQRVPTDGEDRERKSPSMADAVSAEDRLQQELALTRLYQRAILETIRPSIIALDNNDIVVTHNEAAAALWQLGSASLTGKRLQNTELPLRCPELLGHLEASRATLQPVSFQCTPKNGDRELQIAVTIRPVVTEKRQRAGTLIYSEDITDRTKLQDTIEQLEATGEELQSANEELETTNEELQSTNEELETTNEELQSTNEELETTNEELQSLNEELENMNEELEHRTQELNQLNNRYAETLQSMPWPVVMVDRNERIQLWNAAAQRVFGVGATSVVGVDLDHLPIEVEARRTILRRCRLVIEKGKPSVLREQRVRIDHEVDAFDLHFSPVMRPDAGAEGVLIMFGPAEAPPAAKASATPGAKAVRLPATGSSQAKKKPRKTR